MFKLCKFRANKVKKLAFPQVSEIHKQIMKERVWNICRNV